MKNKIKRLVDGKAKSAKFDLKCGSVVTVQSRGDDEFSSGYYNVYVEDRLEFANVNVDPSDPRLVGQYRKIGMVVHKDAIHVLAKLLGELSFALNEEKK